MPWTCESCKTLVPTDDVVACPGCGRTKEAWSFVAARTRAMVVSTKKFDLMTGVDADPLPPGDGAWKDLDVVPAEVARAMRRSEARDLAERGFMPPPDRLLVVLLVPKGAKDLTVKVAVEFETREVEEVELPRTADPAPDVFDVPLLLVAGADDGHELPSFQGVHVLDVTEDTELGHAPTLEVTALKRPPRRVPIAFDGGTRFVEERTGAPVRGCFIYLGDPEAEGFVLQETLFCDEEGHPCRPEGGNVVQAGPPPKEARVELTPGPRKLHWSYAPVEDLGALGERDAPIIDITRSDVVLRRRVGKATLAARLLRAAGKDDPPDSPPFVPLAAIAYAAQGDEPRPVRLEGTTDAEGLLRHEDAPRVAFTLTVEGYAPTIVHALGGDEAPDVVLTPAEAPPRLTILATVLESLLADATDDPADDASDDAPDDAPELTEADLEAMRVPVEDSISGAPADHDEVLA